MRGITLDEIAAATRIGTRSLKALEDEEFKKLPGGIFNKGFVRAYAKFLGISEEQAVSDYLAASGESEKPAEIDPTQLLARRENFEEKSKAAIKRVKELQSVQTDSPSGVPWTALLGLILLVALTWGGRVGYLKYKTYRDEQAQAQRDAQQAKVQADAAASQAAAAQQTASLAPASAQPQTSPVIPPDNASSQPSEATQPPSTPSTTAPKPENEQQPRPETTQKVQPATDPKAVATDRSATNPVQPGNFVVSISARERTWVSITADGKYLMSGELPVSSRKTVEAHNRIVLKTGNAGGTDLFFNGKPLPPLGAEGVVRTVTISADGSIQ